MLLNEQNILSIYRFIRVQKRTKQKIKKKINFEDSSLFQSIKKTKQRNKMNVNYLISKISVYLVFSLMYFVKITNE